MTFEIPLICRFCGSADVKMNGTKRMSGHGLQMYLYHGCGRRSSKRIALEECPVASNLPPLPINSGAQKI